MLELDKPVPDLTDGELAAEVERNYRWNFTVNLLDVTFFWFGLSFISSSTVVPLYISKLSDSPFPIGLAAVIAQAAWFLPQLLTARSVERLPRKKPVVAQVGFFLERLPFWMPVVSALVATVNPTLALVIFLVGLAWRGIGSGIIATSWQDLIANCFPTERRGRFMGLSLFAGTVGGTAAAALSALVLSRFSFSTNFVINFTLSATFVMISWFALSSTREPARKVTAKRVSNREFMAELPGIVREDANFRRFLVARVLLALGGLGTGFITVSAINQWGIPDSTVGAFTAANLMGQAISTPIFGLLADRYGHKLSLELGAVAAALGFTIAWLAPGPSWYLVVFALIGALSGAVIVSGILVVMEFCRPEKRPTYAGLANTAVGVASVIAPLIGATLARYSYDWLFGLSAAIILVALFLLHFTVREPRHLMSQPHALHEPAPLE